MWQPGRVRKVAEEEEDGFASLYIMHACVCVCASPEVMFTGVGIFLSAESPFVCGAVRALFSGFPGPVDHGGVVLPPKAEVTLESGYCSGGVLGFGMEL